MKRWLSRGIVLAMVLAMMVPMPVMAKSDSNGSRLLKSVTYYDYNTKTNAYRVSSKTSFTYDKKGYPSEIKRVSYDDWFLGIPTSGDSALRYLKYKYKGSNPKSMTMANDAGFVTASRKYNKKGQVVGFADNDGVTTINAVWDPKLEDYVYEDNGKESSWKDNGTIAYDKSGLVSGSCYVGQSMDNGVKGNTVEENATYYVTQKKGLPSYIYQSAGNYKVTDNTGKVVWYADYGKDGGAYLTCNSKGLATLYGRYDAKNNKYVVGGNIQLVMKKGRVTEAVITYIDSKGKETVEGKYVFEYTKTKISKQRYMNMINSFVTGWGDYFFWY
jgi:hypothetical protein